MTTTRRRRDQGFTLVEMLIVIVVLGVLATIVVFAVRGIRALADDNSTATDAKTLETAEEGHMALHGVYAEEDELVSAGLLREESELHDIDLVSADEYAIVPAGTLTGGSGTTVPPVTPPAPGATETNEFAGGQHAWTYGSETSPKTLVIIGNGSGALGQQLWDSIESYEDELADTYVVWVDGVSSVTEVEAILGTSPDYIIVPIAVNIGGGTYAGQYIENKPEHSSPTTFWWGQGEQQKGNSITQAIPYYLAKA